jgi:ribosomal protein S12 methylthiotransferase RimO
MKSICVYTISLGCPKNLVDTEKMLTLLKPFYVGVSHIKDADIVLINTCAFIRPAVEESITTILEVAQELREIPGNRLLVVTGCLLNRYQNELRNELPEVDLWIPFSEQEHWIYLAVQQAIVKQRCAHVYVMLQSLLKAAGQDQRQYSRVVSTGPGYAYLKISEGCSHHCRFCLIPQLRGPQVSRPVKEIINEAKSLLEQGVKEICLVAQDVMAYGQDLGIPFGLRTLLDELIALPDLYWLRLLYLYPSGMTRDFLQYLKGLGPPFLPYFDIPFQHTDSEILSQMGRLRHHSALEIVEQVRMYFPEAALRTSLIVGYPGETEHHFQSLLDFVKRARLTHVGVFPFYPEDGTSSARLPHQISDAQKIARKDQVMELQKEISASFLKELRHTWQEVLVEQRHTEWPTLYTGRVWFQAPEVDGMTYLSGYHLVSGQLVSAEVIDSTEYDLQALAE